jgi:hypothetical protein
MRKAIVSLAVALMVPVAGAAPAWGINDPVAPGDECSASTSAIGHPGGSPATNNVEDRTDQDNPVDGVASSSNPGNPQTDNDTSANASGVEQGSDNCTSNQP